MSSLRFSMASQLLTDQLPADQDLTLILEGIGEGFYAVDRSWHITLFNNEAERHFKMSRQEAVGRWLWDMVPNADETPLGRSFHEAMRSRQPVTSEAASVLFPDRWMEYRLFPLKDGLGVRFRDISERKRSEQLRLLLVNELNHRVKNILAMVQGIAAQTFRNAGVPADVYRSFEARLIALGNVHNVLTNESWDSASLQEVVRVALGPHIARNRPQFRVAGPDIRVGPQSAVALSMVLHELCTNAVKYGALSISAGSVDISWHVEDASFNFIWREQDGPSVTAPSRRGFGSRLIEQGWGGGVGGGVKLSYEPSGLCCVLSGSLEAVQP